MATDNITDNKHFLAVVLQILSLLISENDIDEKVVVKCRNSLFDKIIENGFAADKTKERAFIMRDIIFILLMRLDINAFSSIFSR